MDRKTIFITTNLVGSSTEEETMPTSPFSGFPQETITFLQNLEANNNRTWFQAHKQDYLEYYVQPTQAFVVALGQRLQTISPNIRFNPEFKGQSSILRIYRDVRFSKEKSPYNTKLRLVFWEGSGKKMNEPPPEKNP